MRFQVISMDNKFAVVDTKLPKTHFAYEPYCSRFDTKEEADQMVISLEDWCKPGHPV